MGGDLDSTVLVARAERFCVHWLRGSSGLNKAWKFLQHAWGGRRPVHAGGRVRNGAGGGDVNGCEAAVRQSAGGDTALSRSKSDIASCRAESCSYRVLHFYLQKGSLPAPLLVGVLLFSVLFWRRAAGYTLAQKHLYMGTQAAVAGLMVFQEFIFAYLFLVLVGQSVLMFSVRSGLIWAVTLYAVALAANWLQPGDSLLAPAIRRFWSRPGWSSPAPWAAAWRGQGGRRAGAESAGRAV